MGASGRGHQSSGVAGAETAGVATADLEASSEQDTFSPGQVPVVEEERLPAVTEAEQVVEEAVWSEIEREFGGEGERKRGYGGAYQKPVRSRDPAARRYVERGMAALKTRQIPVKFSKRVMQFAMDPSTNEVLYGPMAVFNYVMYAMFAFFPKDLRDFHQGGLAHEVSHVAFGSDNAAAGAAFPLAAKIGAGMRAHRDQFPPSSVTHVMCAMAERYVDELLAYRRTGTTPMASPAADDSLEQRMWGSLVAHVMAVRAWCTDAKVHEATGFAKVTDTRSYRDWVHFWLSLSPAEQARRCGESLPVLDSSGAALPAAQDG